MSRNLPGFTKDLESQLEEFKDTGFQPARIISVNRDNYLILHEHGECLAELTGKLIYTSETSLDRPTTGDWVLVQLFDQNTFAVIHDIMPRRSLLKRKAAGKLTEFQLIAANLDVAFILQATDFNINRLERYLVMVREGGIEPIVLLGKSDLFSQEELDQRTLQVSEMPAKPKVIVFNCIDNSGIDKITDHLHPDRTYGLIGSSGVGKTTLLNLLLGEASFAVAEVREKDGRGRHTTTRREMVFLENGSMIIDTPGMRELANFDIDSGMEETFGDIYEFGNNCRYKDCTHVHEKGCAVIEALGMGSIDENHYQNYLKLQKESAHLNRSYHEKRIRDKQFGKMVKEVMKYKRKK